VLLVNRFPALDAALLPDEVASMEDAAQKALNDRGEARICGIAGCHTLSLAAARSLSAGEARDQGAV